MNEPTAIDPDSQGVPTQPGDQREALLAAAVAGKEAAIEELLAQLAPQLMQFLERQMGSRLRRYLSIADIAQESLASLLSSLDHLRPQAGLSDARYLLFQHARWIVMRRGTDAGRFDGESVCQKISRIDRAESTKRSTGVLTLEDELSWLYELIEEMNPDLSRVMRLRLEDKSFIEIAQELGLSESAVRRRFERGLDELQRLGRARKHE